mmetsp:Transcript_11803/g.28279  ORF Transcript_11803/g.28279 Transcript_11803/m.28279 type:complete len:350 (-) Transcript_11803:1184-2233(-)
MATTTNVIVIDSGELPTSRQRQRRQCRPRSIVWTTSLVVTTTIAFVVVIFGQHSANAYNIVKNDGLSPVSNRRRLQQETEISRQFFFDRRTLLNKFVTTTATATTLLLPPNVQPAYGRNLPKPTGADFSNTGTVQTLIPILQIKCTFQSLIEEIRTSRKDNNRLLPSFPTSTSSSSSSSSSSSQLLFGIPTQEDPFKRLFDEYSVPVSYKQKYLDSNAFLVYYTKGFDGIGRPNIEQQQQGQGAGDSSEDAIVNEIQTVQYGSRNEVWVAWDSFQAEYSYFRSTFMTAAPSSSSTSSSTSSSLDDDRNESFVEMIKYLEDALKALDTYLRLVPEEQLREAATRTISCSV